MEVCNAPPSVLTEFVPPKRPQAPSPVSLPSSSGQKQLREPNAAGMYTRVKADISLLQ